MLLTGTATLASMGILGFAYFYVPYKIVKEVIGDMNKHPVKRYKINEFMNK